MEYAKNLQLSKENFIISFWVKRNKRYLNECAKMLQSSRLVIKASSSCTQEQLGQGEQYRRKRFQDQEKVVENSDNSDKRIINLEASQGDSTEI